MNFWNLEAPIYKVLRKPWPLNLILRRESEQAARLFATLPTMQGMALDLGCGSGHSYSLIPAGLVRIAMDRSPAMIRRHQARASGMAAVGDARRLPFKSGSFVLVSVVGLMEYVPSIDRVLLETARSTASKGTVLISCTPKNLYGTLRGWMGHQMYFHRREALFQAIKSSGLAPAAVTHLFSQDLVLMYKM
jgi:SAM-dependent methyltransferase